ncbi:MAG: 4-hydroxy-tetrahydrodipicolinate synthase [Clostridiaceae bacterium]|nr:4-hydroxy-tetrahydrodipicolinate synthase [Clostridiaceae bacterium]
MKKPIFQGSGVAIVTPFCEGGVDSAKLRRLVDFHLSNETDAIIVCGTTGEASTMPDAEHLETIRIVVEQVNGKIPVIAGTGSNDTAHGAVLSKEATARGADALLIVTPYYNKASQEGLFRHFEVMSKASDLPIVLYNVPSRTNINIDPKTICRLVDFSNIVAIKECNLMQVPEVRNLCGDRIDLYSGEDGVVVPMLSLGAKGVISVAANILPAQMSRMVHSYLNGDVNTSRDIQISLTPLIKALFSDVNPIPVKEALNILGWDIGNCRLPLCDMSVEKQRHLASIMAEYDFGAHASALSGVTQ